MALLRWKLAIKPPRKVSLQKDGRFRPELKSSIAPVTELFATAASTLTLHPSHICGISSVLAEFETFCSKVHVAVLDRKGEALSPTTRIQRRRVFENSIYSIRYSIYREIDQS